MYIDRYKNLSTKKKKEKEKKRGRYINHTSQECPCSTKLS